MYCYKSQTTECQLNTLTLSRTIAIKNKFTIDIEIESINLQFQNIHILDGGNIWINNTLSWSDTNKEWFWPEEKLPIKGSECDHGGQGRNVRAGWRGKGQYGALGAEPPEAVATFYILKGLALGSPSPTPMHRPTFFTWFTLISGMTKFGPED